MADQNLGTRILRFVETALKELEASVAPGLRLPKLFGGHLVRSNALADLLYLLAMLVQAGTEDVGGINLRNRADELLLEMNPDDVEGFWAYRVADSVDLLGGLSALSPSARDKAASASGSPRLVRDIIEDASKRSPNFIVVAARCLHGLERLSLSIDSAQQRQVQEMTLELFRSTSRGWINDGRPGHSEFDIYTPEMYLLAEPFRERLESNWEIGLSQVVSDLEKLCQPSGVITWGRSVGALASAMSLELSVVSLVHGFGTDRSWWMSVGNDAAISLEGWFQSGLLTADQNRASDLYRGPARRLQQTFDLLAKMVWSAIRFREVHESIPQRFSAWPDVDELIRFSAKASAWTHRSNALSFVLPLMAGRSAEYLPTPRYPGLFEQPVNGFPLLIPTVTAPIGGTSEQVHLTPAGVPTWIAHEPNHLEVRHNGWEEVGELVSATRIEGTRTAIYRVSGRSLEVQEHIVLAHVPQLATLTLAVGDVPGHPVRVKVDPPLQSVSVVTAGMAEWRTQWNQLERVHQIEIGTQGCADVRFKWKLTPDLVVATTEPSHQYSCSLFEAMPTVHTVPAGFPDDDLARRLRSADLLHLAWPERWVGIDPNRSRQAIEMIRAAGVPIVLTQHNLLPHRDHSQNGRLTYSMWAEAADGVIHHSEYGKRLALALYDFPRARHYVIPHGHWGAYFPPVLPARTSVEAEEGWPSTEIRLAVIGQPRREKTLQRVVDAVATCDRDDIQLVARLSVDIRVPPDTRILPNYGHIDTARYYRRLTAVDAVILPFEGDTMLTTGTAFDCIGGGIAAIASPWGFLRETLGEAAICYGGGEEDLVACLSSLSMDEVRASGSATRALQPHFDWRTIGELTAHAFEEIVSQDQQ